VHGRRESLLELPKNPSMDIGPLGVKRVCWPALKNVIDYRVSYLIIEINTC
jgi:hypothetical protein